MKRLTVFAIAAFFLLSLASFAQEAPYNGRNIGYLLSVGKLSLYEEYLSTLPYEGTSIGLTVDRFKLSARHCNVAYQSLLQIDYAKSHNHAGNGTMLYGMIKYHWGIHYRWRILDQLNLYGGGLAGGYVGGIYNIRNSNNPAQAKFNIGISLSGKAVYKLRLGKYTAYLQGQSFWHVLGCTFSPHFGQSYYEIFSLNNKKGIFLLSSFHNTLDIDNRLSVDFPTRIGTLRMGYEHFFLKTKLHKIDTQINRHAFTIGFVKEGLLFNHKSKKKPDNYQSPIYD